MDTFRRPAWFESSALLAVLGALVGYLAALQVARAQVESDDLLLLALQLPSEIEISSTLEIRPDGLHVQDASDDSRVSGCRLISERTFHVPRYLIPGTRLKIRSLTELPDNTVELGIHGHEWITGIRCSGADSDTLPRVSDLRDAFERKLAVQR